MCEASGRRAQLAQPCWISQTDSSEQMGVRNRVGEDKTQPLISLWINCQACPRGAVVWGSGADKQCLSPPGDTHDSSGVFERGTWRDEGVSQGHRLHSANPVPLGVVSPIAGCVLGEKQQV